MNQLVKIEKWRPDWEQFDDQELLKICNAGNQARHWTNVLRKTDETPLSSLLYGVETVEDDMEYPSQTVQDFESGSQYYFHSHSDRNGEFGHLHTYVLESGIPKGIRGHSPATLGDHSNKFRTHSHLVAIVINKSCMPQSMFTINHWSSQEAQYSLQNLEKILDCFDISHAWPSYPSNRWMSALLRLFKPQIMHLFAEREAHLAALDTEGRETPAAEDYDLEVTSQAEISVADQLNSALSEARRRKLEVLEFSA